MRQVKGKHLLILVAGAVALLLAIACGSSAQPAGEKAQQEAPKGPVGKATVAFIPMTTGMWDPAIHAGAADTPIQEILYNRLTETERDTNAKIPGLASKWSVSPDGMTVEFVLRKDVRFHNGELVTPEDVVFSVKRLQTSPVTAATTKASLERILERVEAKGDTVVFRLKQPDWTIVDILSGMSHSVVPKKYLEQVGDDGFVKAPIGTGPFKFVKGTKMEYMEFEAVDYEHFLRQPGVKQLRYVLVGEETTRLAMVQAGEADLAQVSVVSLKAIRSDQRLREIKAPFINGLRLFTWGQEDPQNPVSKLEVRQALNLAIDRQAIADGLYQGYARPVATGYWNPKEPGWPDWGFDAPKQNLEKAKELLAKAGYPGGKGLKFNFFATEYGGAPLWPQAAEVIAEEWRKLGIEVDVRITEWATHQATGRSGKFGPNAISTYTANSAGVKGYVTMNLPTYGQTQGSGAAKGTHPEAAALVAQWDQELDEAKRKPMLAKILQYARDNVTSIDVVAINAMWAAGPRLVEYIPRPTHSIGNMWTIKVKP